jgi:hypothetical protein
MSDIPTSEEIKARQQRIKDWPKTITIPIAEWEAMKADAERYKFVKRNLKNFDESDFEGSINNADEWETFIDAAIKEGN